MSILIKDMEMPESCYECPCGDNEFYECLATKERISYHHDEYGYPDGERQDWCPLVPVPPHGRLIDADAMMHEYAKFVAPANNSDFADAPTWNDAVSLLNSATTIIEAEEG